MAPGRKGKTKSRSAPPRKRPGAPVQSQARRNRDQGRPNDDALYGLLAPDPGARSVTSRDMLLASGVGALAALIFVTTFSGNVGLGDAPESVSGIKSLGVLHAPGYGAYVLFAHAFSDVVPVGSWAFRVNLFSLVCSSVMIAALFLVGRLLGANRAGAAIGALAVASAASVWFNAGFAKHYAFSGMLLSLSASLAILWTTRGRAWLLLGAAALLGVCFGASWELALIMAVSVVVLLATGSRLPRRGLGVLAVVVMAAIALGSYAFILLRARQEPAVNWGDATTTSRLLALVTQRDFRSGGAASSHASLLTRVPLRVVSYGGIVARDVGLAAAVLALVGIAVGWKHLPRDRQLFLVSLAGLNLLTVIVVVGIDHIMGFRTSVIAGGYLLDLMIVVAVLVAIGFAPLCRAVSNMLADLMTPDRDGSRAAAKATALYPVVAITAALVVLGPSLLTHFSAANHRTPPLADRYGHRVLAGLPSHSVLVVYRADWAFPLIYRQIVAGERRDVAVINVDNFALGWYRQQTARSLGIRIHQSGPPLQRAIAAITELRKARPVYLDTSAMQLLQQNFGYRPRGLVGELLAGKGIQPGDDLAAASSRLRAIDREDGVSTRYLRVPNDSVLFFHERGHIELAKEYVRKHNLSGTIAELQQAVRIYPDDPAARAVLQFIQQNPTGAESIILNM